METPVEFTLEQQTLRGMLHTPAAGVADRGVGVVFLHGWAGSRIGPHGMFVHMARRLSAQGCHSLRFDFRGRGESDGATAAATIGSMIADTRAAIDFFMQRSRPRALLLLGICSGGKVAVGAAAGDPRADGLALWSAEPMGPLRDAARKAGKAAFALRAYLAKLRRPETWRKLLLLRVNVRMVRKAVAGPEFADARERREEGILLERFRSYPGEVFFIYGTNDPETKTAQPAYTSFCTRSGIPHECHAIDGANHSFYSLAWEREVLELTEDWIRRKFVAGRTARG